MYPLRHQVVAKRIANQPVMRREAMATLEARISARLAQEGLPFRLVGRVKAPWSIYQKMLQESKGFDQVMDVFGFRIVVPRLMQCYCRLGAVHSLFKPPRTRASATSSPIPKANGTRACTRCCSAATARRSKVQIRTEEWT
jgi:guanosine-3',5'-bis(diphosphate) 3'-pyrophosphohydrolase